MKLTIEITAFYPITNEKGEKECGLDVEARINSDHEDAKTICPEQVNILLKVQEAIFKAIKAYQPRVDLDWDAKTQSFGYKLDDHC